MGQDVAVVTGGTSGIGRSIAFRLAKDGFEVYAVGRTAPPRGLDLERLHWRAGDVRHAHTIRAVMDEAKAAGALRVLVNCAGIVKPGNILDVEPASIAETFNVNVIGAITASREFLRATSETWRRPGDAIAPGARPAVVMIASTSGQRPSPGWAAYGASKAAMISIGQSLAAEFPQVNVITLSPGRTATRLRRALAPLEDQQTIQQPEDVAAEVAHLLAQADAQAARSFEGSPITVAMARAAG